MEKKGIRKLGFVTNLRNNEYGENCFTFLSKLVGSNISPEQIDDFIESEDFNASYYDEHGCVCDESSALSFKFKIPNKSKGGRTIFGVFTRNSLDGIFYGVKWEEESVKKIGYINSKCFEDIAHLVGQKSISMNNIDDFVVGEIEFFNGAGHMFFSDGDKVDFTTGKFARFELAPRNSLGDVLYGWFTKNFKGQYEGLNWGTESDFKSRIKERERFFVGRMAYDSLEACNAFLKKLEGKTIKEPWTYKNRKDEIFQFPILKSYLEYELDRLFYEQEDLGYKGKLLYNKDKSKVLFNTNLIDKFGHDLNITGDLFNMGGKSFISNLEMAPSKLVLKQRGFDQSDPEPPEFFKDINEIVFHCEWEVDSNLQKYEHIIEQRIGRFPNKYQELGPEHLGGKLDNAISFAKKIAQRNYKFIVPMYYPTLKRIQLLMPIYLESTYTANPDFALVLTPHAEEKLYTPETILGLDEVYQDARLIAKPDESWLNPLLITDSSIDIR